MANLSLIPHSNPSVFNAWASALTALILSGRAGTRSMVPDALCALPALAIPLSEFQRPRSSLVANPSFIEHCLYVHVSLHLSIRGTKVQLMNVGLMFDDQFSPAPNEIPQNWSFGSSVHGVHHKLIAQKHTVLATHRLSHRSPDWIDSSQPQTVVSVDDHLGVVMSAMIANRITRWVYSPIDLGVGWADLLAAHPASWSDYLLAANGQITDHDTYLSVNFGQSGLVLDEVKVAGFTCDDGEQR